MEISESEGRTDPEGVALLVGCAASPLTAHAVCGIHETFTALPPAQNAPIGHTTEVFAAADPAGQ